MIYINDIYHANPDQSIERNMYSAIFHKRIRGAEWQTLSLGVLTFMSSVHHYHYHYTFVVPLCSVNTDAFRKSVININ